MVISKVGLNWSQVSAGIDHSLGVTDDGIAYAWGANSSVGPIGSLGNGTTINRSSPVTVIGGITTWIQVDAGSIFSSGIALK
jgi:alpha-tubulin suppressor-like RCC1 family protein